MRGEEREKKGAKKTRKISGLCATLLGAVEPVLTGCWHDFLGSPKKAFHDCPDLRPGPHRGLQQVASMYISMQHVTGMPTLDHRVSVTLRLDERQ